jgi:hypothetical protein
MAAFPSPLPVLLLDSPQLDVESLNFTDEAIVMIAGASGDTASCPLCGVCSCHVHSQYGRTLRDLPWQCVRPHIFANASLLPPIRKLSSQSLR